MKGEINHSYGRGGLRIGGGFGRYGVLFIGKFDSRENRICCYYCNRHRNIVRNFPKKRDQGRRCDEIRKPNSNAGLEKVQRK